MILSPSGNITYTGELRSTSGPSDRPLLVQDSTNFTNFGSSTWNAKRWALAGDSNHPLIGMWTSPGRSSMALGFGGYPNLSGDNFGARAWTAKNSTYVDRILFLGSEGNWLIQSAPANTWQTSNWAAVRSWGFHYAGSTTSGQSTPGGFSSHLFYSAGTESATTNPGAYFWSNQSSVMWISDIGTNKRELRVKFFGNPSSGGYGTRPELSTRVIASTEWSASRWRGTGSSDPASPQDGDLFFRTDTWKVRIFAAGSWRDLN